MSMQVKKYLCVVCRRHEVVESRVEHRIPYDEVPDVGGCDYSKYTDHKITGGWLLEDRPDVPWGCPVQAILLEGPLGGICNGCLTWDVVSKLIKHIRFAEELPMQ